MTVRPQRADHGIYKDERQATGYAWYCPELDWRFAISRSEMDNPFAFCPGCALDVVEERFGEIRSGRP
jgi:hypothetical protein